MSNNQAWGTPQKQTKTEKRTIPYVSFNNSNIKEFKPLEGTYNFTILTHNGWDEPYQMWWHEVREGKRYIGHFFSRKVGYNDNCPFDTANKKQLQMNNGQKIDNKDRIYPVIAKNWIAIKVDEIPECEWMLYALSDKYIAKIQKAFQRANGNPNSIKLELSRVGENLEVDDTFLPSQKPFDPNTSRIALPTINKDNYKSFFIGLQDPHKEINFGSGFDNTAEQAQNTGATYQQKTWGAKEEVPFDVGDKEIPFIQSHQTSLGNGDYVVKAGPHAGKKLSQIPIEIVRLLPSLEGEIAQKATEYLKSIGQ